MNFSHTCRSIALGLVILVCSFASAQAQTLIDNADAATKSANNSTDSNNNLTGDSNKKPEEKSEKEPDSAARQTEYMTSSTEYGFWGGSSTVHKDIAGASAGGNFVIGAFRFSHAIKKGGSVRLKYFFDVVPVAVLNYPRERFYQTTPTVIVDRSRQTVYGFGFAPGGLQINFRNHKRVQPFIAGSLGLLYFTKPVPDNRTPLQPDKVGERLNFTGDPGAGVEIGLKNNKSFFIGYKYYHISNGYRGNVNVGFNSNMIYAGMNFGQ